MGNKQCSATETYENRFKNKYQFISLINDPNFGDVKIYRKKQLNFDYVMVLHKYIQSSKLNRLVKEIQAIHAAFLKQNQPMALRIFNFDIDESQIRNCALSLVKIYVEYFNFTLDDLVQAHKVKRDSFTYDELVYIIHSCIVTYHQFLDITQKNLNLTTKSIYLSLEGCLKFCPIRPHQFFQHQNLMCNTFCNETVYKQITNFERGQKYLLAQLRKIFSEISQLSFDGNPQIYRIYELLEYLRKCQTIQYLLNKIGEPKVQILNVTYRNEGSTVSGEDKPDSNVVKTSSKLTKKPYSASDFSQKMKTNENQNVKLSLTKSKQPKLQSLDVKSQLGS